MSAAPRSEMEERLAALPPEKRRLLELRLRREGLAAERRPAGPPPVPRRDPADPGPFPLTFGQQRLWFIERLNPGTAAYNVPFAGRLRGRLRPDLLERALREVMRRHELLRSRFLLQGGQAVQVIDPEPFIRLPLVDLTGLPRDAREDEAARIILAEPQLPFDLERGPVIRVSLVKVGPERGPAPGGEGETAGRTRLGALRSQLPARLLGGGPRRDPAAEEHVLLVTMPHLVTDAVSMANLFRELPAIYEGLRQGRTPSLPELPVQVADYALWQRAWLQGEVLEEQLRFWREYLAAAPPVLSLPTDRPRPAAQTFRGRRLPMALPPEVIRGLKPFNERHGVTSFMTLLAVLDVFLQRWAGTDDVVVGSPVVTRPQAEIQPLIGFFLNMAVLRARLDGDPTFAELLLRVRDSTLASLAHQDLPFERLAEAMGAARELAYPPLVQVSFILQNVHIPYPAFEGITLVDSWQTDTGTARFDLGVGIFEEEGDDTVPQGGFDYNTDLFDEATVLRMRDHFLSLAAAALADPGRRISDLPMLSETERHQLLAEWNDAAAPLPGRLFHELVLDAARVRPDGRALVGEGETVAYRELAERVEALAGRLRALGAGPEAGVGVCLERSPGRVAAFLAVLASGGFYLPLDPSWPAERLRYQLRDAGAGLVVTTPELAGRLGLAEVARPVFLEGEDAEGTAAPREVPPEALACVFHTSGSTGRPKGVMISRASLANLAEVVARGLGEAPGERVLQSISPAFDASLMEIAAALPAGRELHIPPPSALMAGPELAAFAAERGATCGILTPGALSGVPEGGLAGVGCITLGGEAVPPGLARQLTAEALGRRLFDVYGPTEGTVCATLGEVEPGLPGLERPAIGRPVANARIYVLDPGLRPVPRGAHGELCVGGAGVARGYLGRPELTAEVFVPDPFAGAPGARLYRTGDRARHLPDGRLDYLGRLDAQLKVRGVRIEPGEIEALLREHPAVREAAVVLREGDGRLLACVVRTAEAAAAPEALREHLRSRLPEAMVPAAFAFLEALPLTPVGKVDRRALARVQPEAPAAASPGAGEGAPPASGAEARLAEIWAQALKVERVGVHDDFFDLGGDSILAIQVVARAAEAGLYLEPRHLFEQRTVAGVAAVAATARRVDAEQGPVSGPVPLTPVQRAFLEELDPPAPQHWNLSLRLEAAPGTVPGPAALARAAARLVAHHDELRARFVRTGSGWRQEIPPPDGEAPFVFIDLSALPESARGGSLERAEEAVQAGFRLERGPLLRAALFDLGPERPARLLLAAHHLVVDAVSWPILLADLRAGMDRSLPPKTTSFRRWAERLRGYAGSAELRQELELWRGMGGGNEGGGGGRPAPLPVDIEGAGPALEGRAARVEAGLGEAETRRFLSELPEARRASPEEALLAAVAVALAEWRGGREVLLAVEGHGREALFEDVDLTRTVGWFTTVFPLRLELPEAPATALGEALGAVKERLRRVPRRGLGHGVLRYLAGDEAGDELRRQPLPDVCFNYVGRADGEGEGVEAGPFRLAPDPGGAAGDARNPRPYPLAVDAFVRGGELRLVWTFDTGRWHRGTVERLAAAALEHLRALLAGGFEAAHTPADFPHAGLPQDQLERLLGKIGRKP